jgi:hypothetical protein
VSGRGTAVLLGVLAALAGYLWLVELPTHRVERPSEEAAGAPLLSARDEVGRVELEAAGERLAAVRVGGRWTDPHGRPWRGDAVGALVASLAVLRPIMVIDPAPREPAEYGLGPDAARLELRAADGRSLLRLEIGERNPAWTGLYARLGDRPEVVLVGAQLRWEIEKVREAAPRGES